MKTSQNYRALSDVQGPEGHEKNLNPVLSAPSVLETDFAELDNGSLAELIGDPEDVTKSVLAVYDAGNMRLANRVPSGGRVLVPISDDQQVVKRLRLPRGVAPCASVSSLLQPIQSVFAQCLDLDDDCSFLLALFVLSSWFIEQLPVPPYVALVGLPGSGKSTVLKVLRLLCRRALLAFEITSAAFYRVCDRWSPTLLIDELGTARDQRALLQLLKGGTVRDSAIFRKDESFSIFGPKAFSWLELPNDAALNSRCVLIPLRKSHRSGLKSPDAPEIVQAADDLQKQMLYLRFERYKKLTLPKMEENEDLRSRAHDIYEAFALAVGDDHLVCKRLQRILGAQEQNNREPLDARQSAVLGGLFLFIHNIEETRFTVGDLTGYLNRSIRGAGDRIQLSAREIGAILTSLGFVKKRTRTGYQLLLDNDLRKRVHDLASTYGLDNRRYFFHRPLANGEAMTPCDLCREKDTKVNDYK